MRLQQQIDPKTFCSLGSECYCPLVNEFGVRCIIAAYERKKNLFSFERYVTDAMVRSERLIYIFRMSCSRCSSHTKFHVNPPRLGRKVESTTWRASSAPIKNVQLPLITDIPFFTMSKFHVFLVYFAYSHFIYWAVFSIIINNKYCGLQIWSPQGAHLCTQPSVLHATLHIHARKLPCVARKRTCVTCKISHVHAQPAGYTQIFSCPFVCKLSTHGRATLTNKHHPQAMMVTVAWLKKRTS